MLVAMSKPVGTAITVAGVDNRIYQHAELLVKEDQVTIQYSVSPVAETLPDNALVDGWLIIVIEADLPVPLVGE